MFVVYVVFVVIPLLYVFLDVLLVQETIKTFEFEFEFYRWGRVQVFVETGSSYRHGNWINFSHGKRSCHCENTHRFNKCQRPKISQWILHILTIARCWSTVDVQHINRENTLTKPRPAQAAAIEAETVSWCHSFFFLLSVRAYWRRWQLSVPSRQNKDNKEFQ